MEFSPLQKKHFKEIVKLSSIVFGEGYLPKSSLSTFINSPTSYGYVAIVNEKTIAYILIELKEKNDFLNSIASNKKRINNSIKAYNQILNIKQVAVRPQQQKKGIASQLMSLALKQNESTFDISISIAWNKVGVTALKGSLLRNNFTPLLTLDNYWKTDSIKNNYCCSYCGAPPCYCKAEVFIKKNAPTKS